MKPKILIILFIVAGIFILLLWGFATRWTFSCSGSSGGGCITNCPSGNCGSDGCGGTCKCPDGKVCVNGSCAVPIKSTPITVECLFNAPNPLDISQAITNVNDWMNTQVTKCSAGDIMYFSTDYMAFDDDLMNMIDNAVSNGAILIIGIDRLQIGGGKYNCGEDNWCCGDNGHPGGNNCFKATVGNFDCLNDKGTQECDPSCINGCTCFLCGTQSCQSINRLLSKTNITKQCGKNVIILDCPTDSGSHVDKDTSLHSHRKIVSFYRKTGPSSVFKGSWNISGRDQLKAGGLRESGVGITMDTNSDIAQYFLMTDIDATTALKQWVSKTETAEAAITALKTLNTMNKYPTLPMKVDISWSGPDPQNPMNTVSGVDKNMDFYYGVSPSPQKPQIEYKDSTKTMPNGPDKLNWAEGNIWAGTVLDIFFDSAIANSSYIKMQMYFPDITINSPGPGLYNLFPPVPQAVINYVKSNKNNSVLFLLGWYGEPGTPDPQKDGMDPNYPAPPEKDSVNDFSQHWFMQQMENGYNLSVEQKKQIYMRFFYSKGLTYPNAHFCNSSGNGCAYYKNCQVCGTGEQGCCKAHDKIFISEVGVQFSSGQISSGYYNALWWMNDDILFLNNNKSTLSTFAAYWSSWFNLLYAKNSLPPDQNPKLADSNWDRTTSTGPPDAFNCQKLSNQGLLNSGVNPNTMNCYMNFPTIYSTEDIYKDKSYLSWNPQLKCPGGREPVGNSGLPKVFCEYGAN